MKYAARGKKAEKQVKAQESAGLEEIQGKRRQGRPRKVLPALRRRRLPCRAQESPHLRALPLFRAEEVKNFKLFKYSE